MVGCYYVTHLRDNGRISLGKSDPFTPSFHISAGWKVERVDNQSDNLIGKFRQAAVPAEVRERREKSSHTKGAVDRS